MEEGAKTSIIFGMIFLATTEAIINVQKGELVLRLHEDKMTFNVFKAMSYLKDSLGECMRLDLVDAVVQETLEEEELKGLIEEEESASSEEVATAETHVQGTLEGKDERKEAPKFELKALPPTLKYAYLGKNESYPPYLFKKFSDGILRRCISEEEGREVLWSCHSSSYGSYFGGERTAAKVLQCGFFWPTIFKDAKELVRSYDECQRAGNLPKRNEMPQ
ncbi:uncharacterized protein [Arachis hypogaea]|uniref:uncharacterized protein n=1 Tax=Arachis hypogaea TaxID=3818 RepID=UPI003B21EDCD